MAGAQKQLRSGFTTGSATAAALAKALEIWPLRDDPEAVGGIAATPMVVKAAGGPAISVPVEKADILSPDCVMTCVVKDAGDDPDVTHGMEILIYLYRDQLPEILKDPVPRPFLTEGNVTVAAGRGVGQVTLPGLKIPPGEPAVNPVPREMIRAVIEDYPVTDDVTAVIVLPEGETLAQRTFNPKLGITGGISIIGTTGVVLPMSEDALKDSLLAELSVALANGGGDILLAFGRMGQEFAFRELRLGERNVVMSSNFVGFMLDHAVADGATSIVLCGALGKMLKVAAGIFQTHSKVADARSEIAVAYTAELFWVAGETPDPKILKEVAEQITTDGVLEVLETYGLKERFIDVMVQKTLQRLRDRAGKDIPVGVVLTDGRGRLLTIAGEATTQLRRDA